MKPIKIQGEAKTATTYLERLIELNTNAELSSNSVNAPLGWKHGFPIPGDALHIFLFRDPYEWVKSYLADPSDSRFDSLTGAFGNRAGHIPQKHWGSWNHMMQARNCKYKAYREFAQENGGILLKTEYLKIRPQCISVLSEFGYEVNNPIDDITSHVYKKHVQGKDDPKRKPLTNDQRHWISEQDEVGFVDGLTIQVLS